MMKILDRLVVNWLRFRKHDDVEVKGNLPPKLEPSLQSESCNIPCYVTKYFMAKKLDLDKLINTIWDGAI